MKKIILFALAAGLMLSCKTEKLPLKDQNFEYLKQQAAKVAATQSSDSCNCLPAPGAAGCNNTIIQDFFGGTATAHPTLTKTITWSNCTTSDYSSNQDCNVYYSTPPTSTLKLCYHTCNTVTAQFIGLPPCLPCYPNDFCMVLTPSSHSSSTDITYQLQGTQTFYNSVTIKLVISVDPKITVQCSTPPDSSSGLPHIFTCYGSY